jgi:hypothetical protein
MPSGRPPSKIKTGNSTARTVHIEEVVWERIMTLAFNSRPRRSASDVVRDMIERQLPKLENELAAELKTAS